MKDFFKKEEFIEYIKENFNYDVNSLRIIEESIKYGLTNLDTQEEIYNFINNILLNNELKREEFDKFLTNKSIIVLEQTPNGLISLTCDGASGMTTDQTDVYNGFKWLFDFICNTIAVYDAEKYDEIKKFSNCDLSTILIHEDKVIIHKFKNNLSFNSFYGANEDRNITIEDVIKFMNKNLKTIEMSYIEE